MVLGEKIVVSRTTNGWLIHVDRRPGDGGENRDDVLVARTTDEMLELVRISAVDAPTESRQ